LLSGLQRQDYNVYPPVGLEGTCSTDLSFNNSDSSVHRLYKSSLEAQRNNQGQDYIGKEDFP